MTDPQERSCSVAERRFGAPRDLRGDDGKRVRRGLAMHGGSEPRRRPRPEAATSQPGRHLTEAGRTLLHAYVGVSAKRQGAPVGAVASFRVFCDGGENRQWGRRRGAELVRRGVTVCVLVAVSLSLLGAEVASARSAGRVFYLAVHPRECLVVPTSGSSKMVLVVPCSDAAHNLEVYAVGHGGWGHSRPPAYAQAYAIAKAMCLSAFRRVTGRVMGSREGWLASWPDPGAETARYGDKIICGFRAWPRIGPLGSGWHVR